MLYSQLGLVLHSCHSTSKRMKQEDFEFNDSLDSILTLSPERQIEKGTHFHEALMYCLKKFFQAGMDGSYYLNLSSTLRSVLQTEMSY